MNSETHFLLSDIKIDDILSECEYGDPMLFSYKKVDFSDVEGILKRDGWMRFPLLCQNDFSELKALITKYIVQRVSKHIELPDDFKLEDYHKYVLSDQIHQQVSNWAFPHSELNTLWNTILRKIELLLDEKLALKEIEHQGKRGEFLGFRIVRPMRVDYNPYHRDAWLPCWRDIVNVWIPIVGFENANSINLLPKSHLLNDSDIFKTKQGAVIDNKTYHVPAAISLRKSFEIIRPELFPGECILFSPYLIHGNGINKLPDSTRVSIELRLLRKQKS